jgi:hypothetical protein
VTPLLPLAFAKRWKFSLLHPDFCREFVRSNSLLNAYKGLLSIGNSGRTPVFLSLFNDPSFLAFIVESDPSPRVAGLADVLVNAKDRRDLKTGFFMSLAEFIKGIQLRKPDFISELVSRGLLPLEGKLRAIPN